MAMIDILRQHYFPRLEIKTGIENLRLPHKAYSCLKGEKVQSDSLWLFTACIVLWSFNIVVVVLGFNVPPTAKVIRRWDIGLKSHLNDWRSRGSNLRPMVSKASR